MPANGAVNDIYSNLFLRFPKYNQTLLDGTPFFSIHLRCIYKKIHHLTFDLHPWDDAQYPLHHVTCAPAQFEVVISNGFGDAFKKIHYLTFDMKYCPVPSTSCDLCTWKFEVAMSKGLGRCIYKKIHYLTLTKCCPVPSTLCDLCTYTVWSCYVQGFRRR